MGAVWQVLFNTTKKLEQKRLLDLQVAMDGGCDRLAQDVEAVGIFRKFLNVLNVLVVQLRLPLFLKDAGDSSRNDISPESSWDDTVHAAVGSSPVDAGHLDTVSWLKLLDQVVLKDDLD